MAFQFVHRISAIDDERARGLLRRAPDAAPVPPWLVIEAVGQLAAWIAMRRTDFSKRPVAALAAEVSVTADETPGDLELEACVERLDARAMLYSGTARSAAGEVVTLRRCVGPLLPMTEFDDPEAVRRRFETLRAAEAAPAASDAPDIVPPDLSDVKIDADRASARLRVPMTAPLFADHFPRRPVYPASLLAAGFNQLAAALAAHAAGLTPQHLRVARLSDYKIRAFSPPGQLLALSAERAGDGVRVQATSDEGRIATGRLEYRIVPTR